MKSKILLYMFAALTLSECAKTKQRPGQTVVKVDSYYADGVFWCDVHYADGGTAMHYSTEPHACDLKHLPIDSAMQREGVKP